MDHHPAPHIDDHAGRFHFTQTLRVKHAAGFRRQRQCQNHIVAFPQETIQFVQSSKPIQRRRRFSGGARHRRHPHAKRLGPRSDLPPDMTVSDNADGLPIQLAVTYAGSRQQPVPTLLSEFQVRGAHADFPLQKTRNHVLRHRYFMFVSVADQTAFRHFFGTQPFNACERHLVHF